MKFLGVDGNTDTKAQEIPSIRYIGHYSTNITSAECGY